jgi:Haemolymph juvenile hormone binding protein (JHBP)
MKVFFVIFLALATSATAQMAPDHNVQAILERFRVMLRTGNPATGFPVMAPWMLDQHDLVYSLGGIIQLAGEVKRTRIDGLDQFVTNSASFNLGTKRMTFSFALNSVRANGWYPPQ